MEKNVAAEEKLLQLIRKSGASSQQKNDAVKNNFFGKLFVKKQIQATGQQSSALNSVLTLLIISVFIIIGYVYLNDPLKVKVKNEIEAVSLEPKMPVNIKPAQAFTQSQDFGFYEQSIKVRDVFRLPWEEPEVKLLEPGESVAVGLADVIKIKGVMIDNNPKVILEEISSQQTFILSIGESINGAVIKKIDEDKVIFDYNNQEVELTPL